MVSDRPKGKKDNDYAQIGILAVIPIMVVVAPLVGYFIGNWADGKLGTEPWLMIAGIVLGMAAAVREIINLVKKAEEVANRDNDDHGN